MIQVNYCRVARYFFCMESSTAVRSTKNLTIPIAPKTFGARLVPNDGLNQSNQRAFVKTQNSVSKSNPSRQSISKASLLPSGTQLRTLNSQRASLTTPRNSISRDVVNNDTPKLDVSSVKLEIRASSAARVSINSEQAPSTVRSFSPHIIPQTARTSNPSRSLSHIPLSARDNPASQRHSVTLIRSESRPRSLNRPTIAPPSSTANELVDQNHQTVINRDVSVSKVQETAAFKARPMPDFSFRPAPRSSSVSRTTIPCAPHFITDDLHAKREAKLQQHLLEEEQKLKEQQAQVHSHSPPKFPTPPRRSRVTRVIEQVPFKLRSEELAKDSLAKLTEKLNRVVAPKRASIKKAVPLIPKAEPLKPTVVKPFEFKMDERISQLRMKQEQSRALEQMKIMMAQMNGEDANDGNNLGGESQVRSKKRVSHQPQTGLEEPLPAFAVKHQQEWTF